MRPSSLPSLAVGLLLLAGCAGSGDGGKAGERPVPVALAPVTRGALSQHRTLHGSLEASSRITVATLVSGRVGTLPVDLGDPVRQGQIVATIDRPEVGQAVRQATAGLAVAQANASQAQVQAQIADRALERAVTLHAIGALAAAELDDAQSTAQRAQAQAQVTEAEVARSEAGLASARVRLDDTAIAATWTGDDDLRLVAERLVDEGSIVSANTPLLTLVDMDPLRAVVFVTERDRMQLQPGQAVTVSTDALPGQDFPGTVARIAPVFDPASRQARVELAIPNPDGHLSPGLFVRAQVVLGTVQDATIVPADALATRDGGSVLFVVTADGAHVTQRPVEVTLRDGDVVAVTGEGIDGQVVVLGQQQLRDGSAIVVPEARPDEAAAEGG